MCRMLACWVLVTLVVAGCVSGTGAGSKREPPSTFQESQGSGGNGGGGY